MIRYHDIDKEIATFIFSYTLSMLLKTKWPITDSYNSLQKLPNQITESTMTQSTNELKEYKIWVIIVILCVMALVMTRVM